MLYWIVIGLFVAWGIVRTDPYSVVESPFDEQVAMITCITLGWPAALYMWLKEITA